MSLNLLSVLKRKERRGRLLFFAHWVFAEVLKVFGVFTQNFGYVVACGVRFKEVASVEFSACSASSADFAVLADATSALEVAFISEFEVELTLL